jgi:ADP-heptose:LPS heptosyltransferase/spore maturation protein CgeB
MNSEKQKILVLNLTRLGDILQSTPLLVELKRRNPGAEIHYLAVSGFAEVCRYIPEIDRIIPFDFNAAIAISKAAIKSLPRRLQEMDEFITSLQNERYDAVFNLSHSRISALLCHLLGAPRTYGLTLDEEGYRRLQDPWARYFFTANLNRPFNRFNLVDIHLGLVCGDFERRREKRLSFRIPDQAEVKAAELLIPPSRQKFDYWVAFQAGASLPSKRYPLSAFADLGQRLRQELRAGIVLLGSRAEQKLVLPLAEALGDSCLNLTGKTDLAVLAAVLRRMHLLITNDTGTQHLATAVGTRILSLCFGSAFSHETGPYGEGHLVVEPVIPCFPCGFHVQCPQFRCHELVTPDDVFLLSRAMLTAESRIPILIGEEERSRRINVYRTTFDADGFWIEKPIIKRPLTVQDLVNILNRVIWKKLLSSAPPSAFPDPMQKIGEELSDYLPPASERFAAEIRRCLDAFARLQQQAAAGQGLCAQLQALAGMPEPALQRINAIAEELARLDREIGVIGSTEPSVNSLVLDFTFGKQSLEGDDLRRLARETEILYRRLDEASQNYLLFLRQWRRLFDSAGWGERIGFAWSENADPPVKKEKPLRSPTAPTRGTETYLVVDTGYFVVQELIRALRSEGRQVYVLPLRWNDGDSPIGVEDYKDFLQRLAAAAMKLRPRALITVNHLGFDREGRLTGLLEKMCLPALIWYVDSPRYILQNPSGNVSDRTGIFVWDQAYLPWLQQIGYRYIRYLPLATDPDLFAHPQISAEAYRSYFSNGNQPLVFVGDSMAMTVAKALRKLPPQIAAALTEDSDSPWRALYREFCARISDPSRTAPFHPWEVWEDAGAMNLALPEDVKRNLESVWTLQVTQRRRIEWIKELIAKKGDRKLAVFGDEHWRRFLNGSALSADIFPPVDYYRELPFIYNRAGAVINLTGFQMPSGLNQRCYDVPAAGGFLLTDQRDALKEQFDPGRNIVAFQDVEDLLEKWSYYSSHPDDYGEVVRQGRRRVVERHTYRHRVREMLSSMTIWFK